MKQFFGAFFGSIMGLIITGIICTIIFVVAIFKLANTTINVEKKEITIKENSILKLNLKGNILERAPVNVFEGINIASFISTPQLGLHDIVKSIAAAKIDKNINGIYLTFEDLGVGFAGAEEVRNALLDFKKSGKFIYAYSEFYSQKSYYIATAASQIYLNPRGYFVLQGLASQVMFYKNMFNKLDIEMQFFRHGKFKSAIEPLILDKMSEANRTQLGKLLQSLWQHLTSQISIARNIDQQKLHNIINNLLVTNPQEALSYKLIDKLAYNDEVLEDLKIKVKATSVEKIEFIGLNKYYTTLNEQQHKNKIAVIYAIGEINSGKNNDDNSVIGSETTCKAISNARLDSNVKAIVLRINSPGGSALASDVIWRELCLAKKTKLIVVSMGDLAASGGYYISCMANKIFAQKNTITGSIGVFGVLPNIQKALSNKLGITIDTVKTNLYSDIGTVLRKTSTYEASIMQKNVERIYDDFISCVAQGRGVNKKHIDSVGQGRVWSGTEALSIGLIDTIGGLNDAIQYAAKKMNILDKYILESLPSDNSIITRIFSDHQEKIANKILSKNLGIYYQYVKQIQQIVQIQGIQARVPYEITIE